ncbi:AP2-like ethylene-responsive transcription factor AIL5 [Typha latifolia]|uniref:AP2-like ethylene-responsive transcription factor AIL5 n=1 Tax=Typha latifolia TaxID=4733 RepID=UPI003C2B34D8
MEMNSNWLSFSLAHHPGLLEAFSTAPPPPTHPHHGGEEEEPKLEDFLGGGGGGGGEQEAFGSELGSIAAGFLRGFPGEKNGTSDVTIASAAEVAAEEPRRSETFGQRTSIYRGVTRHRWTGRYEAHLWDNSCRREGQSRKGRQVYLGGYDKEEKAARAYDLAALKYWGPNTTTNFPVSNYEKEVEEMKSMTRQEFVASIRRKSSGFSRGASIYRGVTRHHQHGRWQARIGRVAGNKDLYLGTFSTQEEAAEAYDIAAIKFRGLNAVTNFDMSRYDVDSILNSDLPIGGVSTKSSSKGSESSTSAAGNGVVSATVAGEPGQDYWSLLALHQYQQQQQQQQQQHYNPSSGYEGFGSGTINMDFSGGSSVMWSSGAVVQGRSSSSNSNSIPYATPVVMGDGSYENSNTMGSWSSTTAPYLYSYQGATSDAAALHTALYGIE